MDDIGNLIYILFVLVLFIVNLFTKSKKKQQQKRGRADDPTTVGPPPSRGKTFEELLEEFTGGQTTTPEPTPAPRPAPKPKPAPVPAYQAPKPKPKKKDHSIMKTDFGRFEEFEEIFRMEWHIVMHNCMGECTIRISFLRNMFTFFKT